MDNTVYLRMIRILTSGYEIYYDAHREKFVWYNSQHVGEYYDKALTPAEREILIAARREVD